VPTYSVVIPVLNGGPFIANALESVLRQTRLPDEIIVVDNKSTDDTVKIINKFIEQEDRIRLIKNVKGGVSATRNLGIRSTTGEFIAFLDADDLWETGKIEAHANHHRLHANCVFSFTNSFESDVSSPWIRNKSPINGEYSFESILKNEFTVNGSASSAVISRGLLLELGAFDESMDFGEDWDLWLRIGRFYKLCEIPDSLVTIRKHRNSTQMKTYLTLKDFHRTFTLLIQWSRYQEFIGEGILDLAFFSTAGSDLLSNWKNPSIRDGSWARQVFNLTSPDLRKVLGFSDVQPRLLPLWIIFHWFRVRALRNFRT
jgi:glycosyltransferase involved in cell wall biosynthesis